MRLDDFRKLMDGLLSEVPASYLDGVVQVEVSPKVVPHPIRGEVYTLGECIPLEWSGTGADLQSRVLLYHGSFQALARLSEPGEFDWRQEAWDTLTHELRHHLEWRASQSVLEAYDWAAEQNFARHEGGAFDPLFYRSGEKVDEGVWKVDDDVFIERARRPAADRVDVVWHGCGYRVSLPRASPHAVRFLVLDGLEEPPPGEAVLVVTPRRRWSDVFRVRREVVTDVVDVEPLHG